MLYSYWILSVLPIQVLQYSIMFQCFMCVQLTDALASKVATCRCLQAPAQHDCVWANRCVTNPSHQSKVKPFFFRALSRKTASGAPQYQRKKVSSLRRFAEEAACPSNLPLMIAAPIRVIPPGRPASRSWLKGFSGTFSVSSTLLFVNMFTEKDSNFI